MIKEKTGNLIESLESGEVNVACHCCNCHTVMSAGIARALADKYPEVERVDKEFMKNSVQPENKLGYFSGVNVGENRFVINLYGQKSPSRSQRAVNYEAIYSAMEKLRKLLQDKEKTHFTIGFPKKMGSDLAGGDWNVIKAMIESVWEGWPSDVYIVELKR